MFSVLICISLITGEFVCLFSVQEVPNLKMFKLQTFTDMSGPHIMNISRCHQIVVVTYRSPGHCHSCAVCAH